MEDWIEYKIKIEQTTVKYGKKIREKNKEPLYISVTCMADTPAEEAFKGIMQYISYELFKYMIPEGEEECARYTVSRNSDN